MKKYTIEQIKEINLALELTDGGFKKASASRMMKGESLDSFRKRFNSADKLVKMHSPDAKTDSAKLRVRLSLTKNTGHRMVETCDIKPGTLFHAAKEHERDEKNKAFWHCLAENAVSETSNLTGEEFIKLAKHNSKIPAEYATANDAGKMVYTKDSCALWLKERDAEILRIALSPTVTSEKPVVPDKPMTSAQMEKASLVAEAIKALYLEKEHENNALALVTLGSFKGKTVDKAAFDIALKAEEKAAA
jgi:hypothetical protein